ncbi:sigma-54 dependent transcriptional regulator [Neptuniibacter sp. 1_MG-2023]|uniref:sigma-54-dependent transcriptional regulator n=1 Tax=Neptuniibacter sp. 1_MG-2023 TaxID=3062662 RepID=UPI0026E418BF|nr:sigma-54 dependent transcriptional regulator [Neptuniibacter sp. 1_MG-2023]MDO6594759.1 sigma-54 dependent transcriptional regulator [Neptuniibacter sp. 1_MG-2023]
MPNKIMIVEDDNELREALCDTLELAGFSYIEAPDAEEALALLAKHQVDMVVTDVNMPGMDGHQLLDEIRKLYPGLPVMLITAFGQVSKAVEAIKAGAVDYLMKPFDSEALISAVRRFASGAVVAPEAQQPIAEESSSKQLLQLARRVAASDSTVLISGESGTGKEVLAQYIHNHSSRADKPFIAINCAAIPENMLEATLFGHEKGAFTGAYTSSPGKFEQADGGTLLLDEVSEMDLGLQAKLLRVLQEQEVERIGGRKVISLNVRVIATTNRKLETYVSEGKFREDLYYRLNVFPLQWRPLRERPADIVPLAELLFSKYCQKMQRSPVGLSSEVVNALVEHTWPGNVRELDNVVQRALILQGGAEIRMADLMLNPADIPQAEISEVETELDDEDLVGQLGEGMRQHEFQLIIDALKATHGSRKDAAENLGISPRTLRYKLAKMRELGLDLDKLLGR